MGSQKLLENVRAVCRLKHFSLSTEKAYLAWIVRFIRYHGRRHPARLGPAQVRAFLTHLAVDRKVSASTQNQALAALLFLYENVLGTPLGDLGEVVRARRPKRLPPETPSGRALTGGSAAGAPTLVGHLPPDRQPAL